jgi:Nucleotidyl transferase AbiEii toxin, Type IV TA system
MTEPDSITSGQRLALAKLAPLLQDGFYLVGGVAIAAHLSHRTSRDLDVFATRDPTVLQADLDHLPGVVISGRAPGTLHLRVDGIPVSLIEYRYSLLAPPELRAELPVPVASIDDLASMKLSAIAGRGAARDFWDLHTIVTRTARPLSEFLDAFRRKYPVDDIGHVIRSLVYFGDANGPLPLGLSPSHWDLIQRDFETWVRDLVMRQTR